MANHSLLYAIVVVGGKPGAVGARADVGDPFGVVEVPANSAAQAFVEADGLGPA